MIGTNCTVGPQRMLVVAEDLVRYSAVPVSAQPNAGQPRRTGPRSFEFAIDGGYFSRYLGPVRRRRGDPGRRLLRHHADAHQGRRRGAAHAAAPPQARRSRTSRRTRVSASRSGGRAPPVHGAGLARRSPGRRAGSWSAAAITPPAGGWAGDAEQAAAELADRRHRARLRAAAGERAHAHGLAQHGARSCSSGSAWRRSPRSPPGTRRSCRCRRTCSARTRSASARWCRRPGQPAGTRRLPGGRRHLGGGLGRAGRAARRAQRRARLQRAGADRADLVLHRGAGQPGRA